MPKPITLTPAEIRPLVAKFRELNYTEPRPTQPLPIAPRPAKRREAVDPNMDDPLNSLTLAPDKPNSWRLAQERLRTMQGRAEAPGKACGWPLSHPKPPGAAWG